MRKLPAVAFSIVLLAAGAPGGWAQTQVQAQVQVAPPPVAATPSELQTRVESLAEGGNFEIHGAAIAYPNIIYTFYSRRGFRPAWSEARVAGELRRALQDTEADGLDPRDYHLPLLEQLSASAAQDPGLEILQTDALLRAADHILFGKVDAASFDAHWNYTGSPKGIDVPQRIELALATGDIYGEIEKLKPTHRMYLALKQELARYRVAASTAEKVTLASGKAIEPDTHDERVVALRHRLSISGDLDAAEVSTSDLYDPALRTAVERFQARMGLPADGKIGKRTIEELNVPLEDRVRQLRVNLDRGRVLLHELPHEFVVVNIAAYWVYLVRGQEIMWDARAQVGKTYRRTPMFRSAIDYLVLNPTWTVPPGIIKNDILPDARRDPASITRRDLKVLDAQGNVVDPASVDWSKYKSGHIPYTLRQDPGPRNALGRVKIMFPNSYSVYLHDTPSQSKFEASDRAFSSGCVRIERPLELAELLLADPSRWNAESIRHAVDAGRTQNVTLPVKVPVLLAYWTAWVDPQGRVNFRRDVYGQDAQWEAALDRGYKPRQVPSNNNR
ncbi:MAG TPA: L,D-transpeptidase family protein [Steroidobacteraceae bacterium]|nr:L,D-transpeptidase family protein [Steroidobacteraceae bacterium]